MLFDDPLLGPMLLLPSTKKDHPILHQLYEVNFYFTVVIVFFETKIGFKFALVLLHSMMRTSNRVRKEDVEAPWKVSLCECNDFQIRPTNGQNERPPRKIFTSKQILIVK